MKIENYMDDKELRYDFVLEKLRKITPVLDDEEQLTDRIMRHVEQIAADAENIQALKDGGIGKNLVMRIGGILSGVAASALIGLLVYDSLRYSGLQKEDFSKMKQRSLIEYRQHRFSSEEITEIIEGKLKSKKTQRARNERLVSVFINRIESQ